MATEADGRAERDAGPLLLHAQWKRAPSRRRTVGADKAYDVYEFIDVTRELGCTPHVAQNLKRQGGSAIDRRTTWHAGYARRSDAQHDARAADHRDRKKNDRGDEQPHAIDIRSAAAGAELGAQKTGRKSSARARRLGR